MKKQNLQEKRTKAVREIEKEIEGKQQDLGRMRLDLKTGTLKNTAGIRALKREIVQLKTLITEKKSKGEQ